MNTMKMLNHNKTNVPEDIDANKTNLLKRVSYLALLVLPDKGFKFQLSSCNRCYDLLMISIEINNIVDLNIHGIDYSWIIFGISKLWATCVDVYICIIYMVYGIYIYIYISFYIYVYIYIYGIHNWRIIWSSKYRKLAWMGFEPTTTEFLSDVLTHWAVRSWFQLSLRANIVWSVSDFISAIAFFSHHVIHTHAHTHTYYIYNT